MMCFGGLKHSGKTCIFCPKEKAKGQKSWRRSHSNGAKVEIHMVKGAIWVWVCKGGAAADSTRDDMVSCWVVALRVVLSRGFKPKGF